jgi:molecular chaperone IbpA
MLAVIPLHANEMPKKGLNLTLLNEEVKKMRTTYLAQHLDELFRDLNRFAVGFEPTFRMLDQVATQQPGYPPYDLEKVGDNQYRLSMAVAGFTAQDIDITVQDGILTIEGQVAKNDDRLYLHKGIAGRNWKRSFYLNAFVTVTSSNLDNGILTIDFVQEIPESMKPKKIAIGTNPVSGVIDVQN